MVKMYFKLCILILFVLFGVCVGGKDLYELLGVDRDANTKEIRKAFKELAVKLHPDKNPDDPNADAVFVELVKAYEILKDPETRKRYDLDGDTGEDAGKKQEYHSYTYYRDQFGIYDDDPLIITLTKTDFELNILDSSQDWFVNFYSPNCHHCHDLANTWRKLSRDFDGIIKIAAVNCEEDWVLCHQQKIHSFPSLFYFKKETHHLHEGKSFDGTRTLEELNEFILSHIKSAVHEITVTEWKKLKNDQWLLLLCSNNFVCPEKEAQLKLSATLEGLIPVGLLKDEKLCDEIFADHKISPIVFWDSKAHSIEGSDVKEIVDNILTLLPHPQILNQETFQDIRTRLSLGDDTPWLICFYLGTATELNLQLKRLPSLLPQMQIGLVHCGKDTKLCTSLHISHYPTWGIIKSGGAFEIHYGRDILHEIVTFAKDSSKSVNLHAISPADFYAQVKDGTTWFIDWFAPWCPPCKKLMPEIRRASQHFTPDKVKFGTIDCTLHRNLCVQEGVRSYPTTVIYKGNQVQYFHGIPNEENIVSFIEDILNPLVIDLNNTNFIELIKKPANELWMVDFFAPWCGPCQILSNQWRALAKQVSYMDFIKIAQLNCETNLELCQNQNVRSYPTIRLYPLGSKGMNTVAIYNGNRNVLSMKQWLLSFLPSPVEALTVKQFKKEVLGGHNYLPWLIDFYAPWCGHCINFEADYISVAQKMEGHIRSGKLDCEAERDFCRELRVTSYPTVILFLTPNDKYEIRNREPNEIIKELKDILRKKHRKDEL